MQAHVVGKGGSALKLQEGVQHGLHLSLRLPNVHHHEGAWQRRVPYVVHDSCSQLTAMFRPVNFWCV